MNKTLFYVGLVVVLVAGLGVGYLAFHTSAPVGVSITPYNCLNQQILCNELQTIANPLLGIEQTSTASITFPAINPTTPQSTTTAIGIAASIGDIVLIFPNGTSTGAPVYSAQVTTASTTSATITFDATAGTIGTSTPNAQTFNVTVLPFSTFKAPSQANL